MPAPDLETPNLPAEKKELPTREITQTDHLNKKLLNSLFQRLDEGGDSILAKVMEPDDYIQGNDEWKD